VRAMLFRHGGPKVTKEERKQRANDQHFRDLESVINPAPWAPIPARPEEEEFRHSAWKAKRAAVMKALQRRAVGQARLDRFACCGSNLTVEWNQEEQRHRVCGCFCHDRHCEPCGRAKGAIIARNLRAKLEGATSNQFRFITLTLRHSTAALKDQINRLMKCFRTLRNSKDWKASQRGGSASLEVKWDPKTDRWHPHLHVIADGAFLGKEQLSAMWHHITTDSFIVDIRLLRDSKEAAHYVAKYAAKGCNAEIWSCPERADEWIDAMHGVRMVGTWGTWRGYRLMQRSEANEGWTHVGTYIDVLRAARRAEMWAVAIMEHIVPSSSPEEVRCQFIMDTGDG
jgi:hypothetical protein